ncbi:MAG: hypothetical protein SH807_09700 [Blastochloris sp.]|nr:hypothetical protein [Blastochloris sp.]
MNLNPATELSSSLSSTLEFGWETTQTEFKNLKPAQRLEWLERCAVEFLALRKAVGLPFPDRLDDPNY